MRRLLKWIFVGVEDLLSALVLRLARARRADKDARQSAQALAYEAWEDIHEQEWAVAIPLSSAAIEAEPAYAEGYRMLGYAYRLSGRFDEARDIFNQGIQKASEILMLYQALGDLEWELGRSEDAEAAYLGALEVEPHHFETLLKLGQLLAASGRLADALPVLGEARAISPSDTRAMGTLGKVLYWLDDCAAAVEVLREAATLKPDSADIHTYLALALSEVGAGGDAEEVARKAVELSQRDEQVVEKLKAAGLLSDFSE